MLEFMASERLTDMLDDFDSLKRGRITERVLGAGGDESINDSSRVPPAKVGTLAHVGFAADGGPQESRVTELPNDLLLVFDRPTTAKAQSLWFSTALFSPIFKVEILDPAELPGIVGDQRKFEGTGVRRDEEIVCADHRSAHFEHGADLCIVKGCCVGKVQNLGVPQILIEGRMVLLPPGRHLDPEQQLRLGDDRDANGTDWNLRQSPENTVVRALHDVGRYIRVEHVLCHQSSRSWTGRSSTPSMNSFEATGPEAR
jgi:hypothetical protein